MVRVNLVKPNKLSDQHLIAEYDEILMLFAYIKKYPGIKDVPLRYVLGKGHMKFFKDKVLYLNERHAQLKKEMMSRRFKAEKSLNINLVSIKNRKSWKPKKEDIKIIKERILYKLNKKPNYYRYKRQKKPVEFFRKLLNS
jgi:deoxyribonuclease (pyrimidine dimer)